jgi:hypothetical protein
MPGDAPGCANPNLDDSSWSNFEMPRRSAPPLGVSCVRNHFVFAGSDQPLVLTIGSPLDAYTLYLNGSKIAETGKPETGNMGRSRAFQLPSGLIRAGTNSCDRVVCRDPVRVVQRPQP